MRVFALALLLVSTTVVTSAGQLDVLSTLGTSLREAQNSIFSALSTGVVAGGAERLSFTAASGDARAVMVRAVLGIARTFAASDDFAHRYAIFRDTQRPQSPTSPRTGDEARAQQQEAIETAVKQALAGAGNVHPAALEDLQERIAHMRRQVAELNADPAYRAEVDRATAEAAREDEAAFALRLRAFDDEYPANVEDLIARRLRHFLRACGDVDFSARVERDDRGVTRFLNEAYERRSVEWKMCFRAGKPAVDAARQGAEEWLKALGVKGW